ncbi:MAG TPA: hypothetical protein VLK33_18435 [Terriglobales bacterium]|nr:hypothetical protein [Terriglobales bacterium]
MEVCFENATVPATIARSKNKKAVEKAKERFDILYSGPSELIGDPDVNTAMTEFKKCISPKAGCNKSLENLSAAISDASRTSITRLWTPPKPTIVTLTVH